MFTEPKITEFYCMTDDFCRNLHFSRKKYIVEEKNYMNRSVVMLSVLKTSKFVLKVLYMPSKRI